MDENVFYSKFNFFSSSFRTQKMANAKKKLNIAIVGKTNYGKSSLANLLIGERRFKTNDDPSSSKNEVYLQYASGATSKYELFIADTTGIQTADTAKEYSIISAMWPSLFQKCNDGYDAIILVLKFGEDFSNVDSETKTLKEVFGSDIIKKHGIIVITNGESLLQEENSFGKLLELKKLFDECAKRVIIVDSMEEKQENINQKVAEILTEAETLSTKNGKYTKADYDQNQQKREKFLKENTVTYENCKALTKEEEDIARSKSIEANRFTTTSNPLVGAVAVGTLGLLVQVGRLNAMGPKH